MPLRAEVSEGASSPFHSNEDEGGSLRPSHGSKRDAKPCSPHGSRCSVPEDLFADESLPSTAIPHAEVPTSEFYKHISADLTEPRRMRCLLGWCGTRVLPSKPAPPRENTPAAKAEFQALQAGMS